MVPATEWESDKDLRAILTHRHPPAGPARQAAPGSHWIVRRIVS